MENKKFTFRTTTSWTNHPDAADDISRDGAIPEAVIIAGKRVSLHPQDIMAARWERDRVEPHQWVVLARIGSAEVSVREKMWGDSSRNPYGNSGYELEVLAPSDSEFEFEVFESDDEAPCAFVTTSEAAALTGEAESTWRNRCASGEATGAVKKGKMWLIPRQAIEVQTKPPLGELYGEMLPTVAGMYSRDLDLLEDAIRIRRNQIMAAKLEQRGIHALTSRIFQKSKDMDEFEVYFDYILVYDPANEIGGEWATLDECQRLIDTVANLEPAEAFRRWRRKVKPLEAEPYTEDDAQRDIRAKRARAQRLFANGEIDAEQFREMYRGASEIFEAEGVNDV